jgi:hypothetical protein
VEIIAGLLMIAAGIATAIFVVMAVAISRGEKGPNANRGAPGRDQIAASILHQLLVAGGASADEAMRRLRRDAGLAAPVTPSIDIVNWGESFARTAPEEQRLWLLETAVHLVSSARQLVPLRQYNSLLDLSFALGFQTDALARLRDKYPFDYVDHAKDARPRDADRAGGATPLFVREDVDAVELLRVLEIEGTASRQVIISAYRRLASLHHPDRHFERTGPEQEAAAARFMDITRAYETLMAIYRE